MPADTKKYRGTETVLVVEDEEGVREWSGICCSRLATGFSLLTAGSRRPIECCFQGTITIQMLITDVVMPKMGGQELAERLCKIHAGFEGAFRVGLHRSVIMHHGVLEPCTHFLQKPFTSAQLGGKCGTCWRVREDLLF